MSVQKLFNNDKSKDRWADSDHLPGGQVGQTGADNVTFKQTKEQILNYTTQYSDITSEQQITIPANSLLYHIFFKKKSGSPICGIGSTTGQNDIWENRLINDIDGQFMLMPFASETSLFLQVSDGAVDINILSIENMF